MAACHVVADPVKILTLSGSAFPGSSSVAVRTYPCLASGIRPEKSLTYYVIFDIMSHRWVKTNPLYDLGFGILKGVGIMLLPSFHYHEPKSLAEATRLMDELRGEACVLAGGTDLLVNMKKGQGLAQACRFLGPHRGTESGETRKWIAQDWSMRGGF